MIENEDKKKHIEKSALFTFIGIILLFSTAIIVTLIAPSYVDPSWTEPTNSYQTQMYTVLDPNVYISSSTSREPQQVYHLKNNFSLLGFKESEVTKFITLRELEKYITRKDDKELKLTNKLLLLRKPLDKELELSQKLLLQQEWMSNHLDAEKEGLIKPSFEILELYDPEKEEAFALGSSNGILENWVDRDFLIIEKETIEGTNLKNGVIYINNPREYKVKLVKNKESLSWEFDPQGESITSLNQLKDEPFNFLSRKELIEIGENLYAIEGCSYCHSDQTRTLNQDVVLNGSDSFPAPPSSANEYVYNHRVTFMSTRRIGPDLSRVGVKRPSRDWHKAHFWSPKTASPGSLMPSFAHFFDKDPRGTSPIRLGVPNYKFEAIFQYLMTKGTRITPPNQAWWIGKDPVQTLKILEGKKRLPK